jgi:CheY-like chemotaxis protein
MIAVADTGSGISEDVKRRMFEPFFTTKAVGKGTGMGLAMVFGAVQDHAGAITVESSEGQGARFLIYLPLAVGEVAEASTTAGGDIEYVEGKETILVAEDEPMVRDVAVRALRRAGYHVVTAVDGEDAVAKFRAHVGDIDMVLLDVMMPKLNGRQAYEQIKQANPSIKVAFCTGYDPTTPQVEAVERACIPTVYKPLSPAALLSTVRQTLEGSVSCQLV